LLEISRSVLRPLLQGELYRAVRHVREGSKRLYCVADVTAALAPLMPGIEARKKAAADREAKERADGAERRAERARNQAAYLAKKNGRSTRPAGGRSMAAPPTAQPSRDRPVRGNFAPEVFVRRRPAT
jgi:hypothetical protein